MTYLLAIAHELGEIAEAYETASGFSEVRMPNKPDMWGWGQYRRTEKTLPELRLSAARKSLAESAVDRERFDHLIICGDVQAHTPEDTARLLGEMGLKNAFPIVLQSAGCESLLTAISLADALVRQGRANNVLISAAGKANETEARFRRYGIFSDAACSCVMSGEEVGAPGFSVIASSFAVDADALVGEFAFDSALAVRTNAEIVSETGQPLSSIRKVFGNNLFLPITTLKENEAGFSAEQVYTDNVRRLGHCFSCDSLINLGTFHESGASAAGDRLMLTADGPGVRAAILLAASDRMAGVRFQHTRAS